MVLNPVCLTLSPEYSYSFRAVWADCKGTATIKVYTFMCEGTKVTLVDTPGFNDTHRSDTDVLKEIVAWTSTAYKEKRLLSGIIYLHRISDVRMEGSALKNLRMFQKLCGENALHNVLLTTTQWSKVEQRQGEARESELKSKKEFWKPLLDRGANLERFHGDMQSGLALIHKLKSRVPKVLDIQEQIVDKKMDLIETSAGQTINEELLKLQKKYSEELETTRQELQAALDSKDEELKKFLVEQKEKEERRLAQIEAERKDLIAKHTQHETERIDYMRQLVEAEQRTARAEEERKADAQRHEACLKSHTEEHRRQIEADRQQREAHLQIKTPCPMM
jgi:chromosome segregation ATPase